MSNDSDLTLSLFCMVCVILIPKSYERKNVYEKNCYCISEKSE